MSHFVCHHCCLPPISYEFFSTVLHTSTACYLLLCNLSNFALTWLSFSCTVLSFWDQNLNNGVMLCTVLCILKYKTKTNNKSFYSSFLNHECQKERKFIHRNGRKTLFWQLYIGTVLWAFFALPPNWDKNRLNLWHFILFIENWEGVWVWFRTCFFEDHGRGKWWSDRVWWFDTG